jgi:hypothetical protein
VKHAGIWFILICSLSAAAAGSTIDAGAAKVDITPPLPATYDLLQTAHQATLPLMARVLYLEDQNAKVIIVATDYEGILRTAYEMIRRAISQETGVPVNSIVVNANHTHNAPWINLDEEDLLAPQGIHQVDKLYFREAVTKIAHAANLAKKNKRRVTISAGSVEMPELCWNRRTGYVRSGDLARFNRKRRYPIGITDPTLGLVRFDDLHGKAVAVLCFYASHYTGAGPNRISASYPGPAMRNIEQEMGPGSVALFLQGCAGDVTPPVAGIDGGGCCENGGLPNGSPEAVEKVGGLFSAKALPVLQTGMRPVAQDGFSFASKKVPIPLAPFREHGSMEYVRAIFVKPAVNASASYAALDLAGLKGKFDEATELYKQKLREGDKRDLYSYVLNLTAYGDRYTLAKNLEAWSVYDFQALKAGKLCLVFLPGESFVEIGLAIRDQAGPKDTFVAAYNDLTPVYVPDETAFDEGGYEVGLWCYSTRATANTIVREALSLINNLRIDDGTR